MPRKKKQVIPARKMGRPSKYEGDKTLDAIDFYLNNFHKEPFNEQIPTMASLSNYLGLSKGTLKEWTKVENREELTVLLEKLLQKQEVILCNSGLTGEFNSSITKLLLFKHGHSEKVESIGFAGSMQGNEQPIQVTFVNASTNPLIARSSPLTTVNQPVLIENDSTLTLCIG